MAQYRSYMVDENSHEKDEITLEIVSFTEESPRNMICRASDGDVEVGFTLHENARTLVTEFVSEGEVTENFVKLLAKLFGKEFPVKKTAKKLKIDGLYLMDVQDDDYWDENGVFVGKCFVGKEVEDKEDAASMIAFVDQLAPMMNADKLREQGLSEEEIHAKGKEAFRAIREETSKRIEKQNYAEFYIHIDLNKKQIGFSQKSQDYQLPILRMLTGTPAEK